MALKDIISKNDSRYSSPEARTVIEDHLEQLRNGAEVIAVSGVLSTKYQTNLYGLYQALKIDKSLWWITSRINRFDHTTDIDALTIMAKPNSKQVEDLIKVNGTKQINMF